MTVTCPTCQLKGVVDPGPLVARTSVVCARCETAYDMVLADDGQVHTVPPGGHLAESPFAEMPLAELALDESPLDELPLDEFPPVEAYPVEMSAARAVSTAQVSMAFDDVLVIPQETFAPERASEDSLILEDVFAVAAPESAPDASAGGAQEHAMAAAAASGSSAQPEQQQQEHTHAPADSQPKVERQPAAAPPRKKAASHHDKYASGVRLLRVAPAWLLLTGLAFVSVLFLLNWWSRPGEENQGPLPVAAAQKQPERNDAMSRRVTTPAPAPQAEEEKKVAPPPRQEPPPPAPKSEAASVSQERPAAPAELAAPPAELKKPAAPAQAVGDAGGKFTVQVGAYNVAEQADERVTSLKSAGFDGGVVRVEIPGRGTWYRVQSGRFASRDEAARYGGQLRAKGVAQSVIVSEVRN